MSYKRVLKIRSKNNNTTREIIETRKMSTKNDTLSSFNSPLVEPFNHNSNKQKFNRIRQRLLNSRQMSSSSEYSRIETKGKFNRRILSNSSSTHPLSLSHSTQRIREQEGSWTKLAPLSVKTSMK